VSVKFGPKIKERDNENFIWWEGCELKAVLMFTLSQP